MRISSLIHKTLGLKGHRVESDIGWLLLNGRGDEAVSLRSLRLLPRWILQRARV